jgi:predicted Zn-dependent peptidase
MSKVTKGTKGTKTTKHGLLNPSLRYIVTHVKGTKEMSLQIRVNVGSRDESPEISGLSHLLEHMFFQGSQNYPTVKELESEVYRCGGNFNAFTDLDETVFHIECSSDCADKACDIVADSLYRSLFLPKKLENEKKVVINELKGYQSNPRQIAQQGLQGILFEGTRLEKDIGGNVATVLSVTTDVLKNFVNTYYTGKDAITVSLVSSKSLSEGVRLLRTHFKEVPHYEVPVIASICNDRKRILYPDFVFQKSHGQIAYSHNKAEQSYVSIGFPAPRYTRKDLKDMTTVSLISELLTGYMSSYLYENLRNKHGLIYHIHSGSSSLEDLGFFVIETATRNQQATVEQTCSLILDLCASLPHLVTHETLKDAQDHLIQSLKLGDREVHEIGLQNAGDLVYLGKTMSDSERQKLITSVKVSDIQRVSERIFQAQNCHISYTGSKRYL